MGGHGASPAATLGAQPAPEVSIGSSGTEPERGLCLPLLGVTLTRRCRETTERPGAVLNPFCTLLKNYRVLMIETRSLG